MSDAASESPVRLLVDAVQATRTGDDSFVATAPDWFGDRVFGGMVVAQALHAACQSVEPGLAPNSLHAYFLGAMRPGPVDLRVERVRDGRTFVTRRTTSAQHGRTALSLTASFHHEETGVEYQRSTPHDIAGAESLPAVDDSPPPFEVRWVGPTPQRPDGTFESTRRCWVRTIEAVPDDPLVNLGIAAFLSDLTGTSFRPLNLGEWATHTDASIDHSVWFHRPLRVDEWLYCDFHALINTGGRSTVRGEFYDAEARLCMSMAQELLIRPLA